ncbi:MAG: hypothetical protein J2P48_21585 [Alphaproteobacteria bacterium]|nr:hypothetical protein [Alphaproteobacteria bacterium]
MPSLGGTSRSARLGAVLNRGVHLETLGRVDTIMIEKTGALTLDAPKCSMPV